MCDCSPPFSFHWNISRLAPGIDDAVHVAASADSNNSVCHCDIHHKFLEPGNYVMAVSVDNGVSEAHTFYRVHVAVPKSGEFIDIQSDILPSAHIKFFMYF